MSKNLNIINCGKNWIKISIDVIKKDLSNKNKNTYIILTGGRFAKKIYANKVFKKFANSNKIILSDERITNVQKFKNKNMLDQYFKYTKILKPYELESKRKYIISFCLLSLGEDGHFASIFPGDKKTIFSKKKYFEYSDKKYKKFKRVSISLKFLSKIKKIYILVNGDKKGHELNKIIKSYNYNKIFNKKLILKYPLLKILNKCIFLIDYKAFKKLRSL